MIHSKIRGGGGDYRNAQYIPLLCRSGPYINPAGRLGNASQEGGREAGGVQVHGRRSPTEIQTQSGKLSLYISCICFLNSSAAAVCILFLDSWVRDV